VGQFQGGGPPFLKRFPEHFFSKMLPNGTPDGLKKVAKSKKNELETKSTKHVENVLNLTPLDLQETRFQMEWLSKITKTRGAYQHKKY